MAEKKKTTTKTTAKKTSKKTPTFNGKPCEIIDRFGDGTMLIMQDGTKMVIASDDLG